MGRLQSSASTGTLGQWDGWQSVHRQTIATMLFNAIDLRRSTDNTTNKQTWHSTLDSDWGHALLIFNFVLLVSLSHFILLFMSIATTSSTGTKPANFFSLILRIVLIKLHYLWERHKAIIGNWQHSFTFQLNCYNLKWKQHKGNEIQYHVKIMHFHTCKFGDGSVKCRARIFQVQRSSKQRVYFWWEGCSTCSDGSKHKTKKQRNRWPHYCCKTDSCCKQSNTVNNLTEKRWRSATKRTYLVSIEVAKTVTVGVESPRQLVSTINSSNTSSLAEQSQHYWLHYWLVLWRSG